MSVLRIFFRIFWWCIPTNSKFVQAFPTVNFPYFIWCCTIYLLRTYTQGTRMKREREKICIPTVCLAYWRHTEIAPVYWNEIETHSHTYVSYLWRTHTHYQELWNLQTHTRIGNLIELNWTESRKRRKKCAREIISVECFAEFFFF